MFWAIKDKNGIFLVDAGIKKPYFLNLWNIKNYTTQQELLSELGITKNMVTAIIITHLHADHIDGCEQFPNAMFYLQKKEYVAIKKAFSNNSKNFSHGYYRRHYRLIEELKTKNRLVLLDGTHNITNNIQVEPAPFHTKGTQSVIVKTAKKTFYIIPDNAYLYENIDKLRPVGICVDRQGNMQYLKRLKQLNPEKNYIIPGHEPEIFKTFPPVGKNVVELK